MYCSVLSDLIAVLLFVAEKLLLVPETFVNADERLSLRDVWAA